MSDQTKEEAEIEEDKTSKEIPLSFSLIEGLVENLEEIKIINSTMRFIRLLIEAKEVIEKDGGNHSTSCLENIIEIKLFSELNAIVSEHGSPNALVKNLQKLLHISENKDKFELVLNLLETKKSKFDLVLNLLETKKSKFDSYETSRENLIALVDGMEDLLKSCELSPSEFVIENLLLERLNFLVKVGSYKAEDVLLLIAEIFKRQVNLSSKDKEEIGVLMVEALEHIRIRIKCVPSFSCFKPLSLTTHLQMRSALQFIFENFSFFPAGEGKLFKDYMVKIERDMSMLDRMLKNLYSPDSSKDENDEDDEVYDVDNLFLVGIDDPYDYLRLQMKEGMPPSHTWWDEYRQGYF